MKVGGQASADSLCHRFQLRQDLVIPEPNHSVPDALKPRGPSGVLLHMHSMLPSVHFDDHLSLQAHEVHNIRSDRMLAAELAPVDLAPPHLPPQGAFSICWTLPQRPGVPVHPPILPFPLRGGKGSNPHYPAKSLNYWIGRYLRVQVPFGSCTHQPG